MKLCIAFLNFKTSLDSLFILGNVIKFSPVVFEKYHQSNFYLGNTELERVF